MMRITMIVYQSPISPFFLPPDISTITNSRPSSWGFSIPWAPWQACNFPLFSMYWMMTIAMSIVIAKIYHTCICTNRDASSNALTSLPDGTFNHLTDLSSLYDYNTVQYTISIAFFFLEKKEKSDYYGDAPAHPLTQAFIYVFFLAETWVVTNCPSFHPTCSIRRHTWTSCMLSLIFFAGGMTIKMVMVMVLVIVAITQVYQLKPADIGGFWDFRSSDKAWHFVSGIEKSRHVMLFTCLLGNCSKECFQRKNWNETHSMSFFNGLMGMNPLFQKKKNDDANDDEEKYRSIEENDLSILPPTMIVKLKSLTEL